MLKVTKCLVFALLALGLLSVGYVGAHALWYATHHRYDQPKSGYYHSSVHAHFSGTDDEYLFRFWGKAERRWQWDYSTNFDYRSLRYEWHRFGAQAGEDSGTIRLPSLVYESSSKTGVLTRAVLSQWLVEKTNITIAATQGIDFVFGFIEAAGGGTLPAPRHHEYSFKEPVDARIQHFRLGFGVGGIVYIWVGVWLLLVILIARRFC